METYKDLNHDSGVAAFEIGAQHIWVRFKKGGAYLYTYDSCGASHVEQMKLLARYGDGLNAYINYNVYHDYADKA